MRVAPEQQQERGESQTKRNGHGRDLDAQLTTVSNPSAKKFLPLLLLSVMTFGVYAPALRDGFVWDDTALILRDPLIRSWRLIPEGFEHFLFVDATASDFYRPMQRLVYTLDYALAGFRPGPYHFTSVLCHLFAALALFAFARELLCALQVEERLRETAAFVAALVWAIHPLQTSAVAYVSGCADPLAAAFGFTALWVALVSRDAPRQRAFLVTIASGALLLFSMLSKEAGFVFPLLWLAILALEKNRRALLRAGSAVAFVFVIYAVLRFGADHTPAPAPHSIPALVRPIVLARAAAEYAQLLVLPINLHMERDVETHPFGMGDKSVRMAASRELETLVGLIASAAFISWAVRSWKRDRPVFTCLTCAALTYLPISGIVPLNAALAEHWLYLPSAFVFLAASIALMRLPQRRTLAVVVATWMVFLGARTFVRTFDWKDQRTFLERTIANGGDSARMLINLGNLDMSEGRFDEARAHLQAALAKDPEQPLAVLSAASLAVKTNEFKTAHELLDRATKMPLVEAQAHELFAVLEKKETGVANLLRMRLAARSGPPNWTIEKRYLQVLDEAGGTQNAIAELSRCLETQWYRAESWQLLSALLTKTGQTRAAAVAAAEADRYDTHLSERL